MQAIQYAPRAEICQIEVPEFKPISKEDKTAYQKAKTEFAEARKAKKKAEPVKAPEAKKNKRFEGNVGALYVRPGATVHVSDDELTILKEAGIPLRVIADSKMLAKSEEKVKESKKLKAKEESPKDPSEGSSGGSGGGSGKGKGKGSGK